VAPAGPAPAAQRLAGRAGPWRGRPASARRGHRGAGAAETAWAGRPRWWRRHRRWLSWAAFRKCVRERWAAEDPLLFFLPVYFPPHSSAPTAHSTRSHTPCVPHRECVQTAETLLTERARQSQGGTGCTGAPPHHQMQPARPTPPWAAPPRMRLAFLTPPPRATLVCTAKKRSDNKVRECGGARWACTVGGGGGVGAGPFCAKDGCTKKKRAPSDPTGMRWPPPSH